MNALGIFDIFNIGVGPSSSHTLGPWKAALNFVDGTHIEDVDRIEVSLYGSLSKTGKGHATDKAVILGLLGYNPITIETEEIEEILEQAKEDKKLIVKSKEIDFCISTDLIFENYEHELHPNTLKFTAFNNKEIVHSQTFASVGGGFIETSEIETTEVSPKILPFPIQNGEDLGKHFRAEKCRISDIVYMNELAFREVDEIRFKLELIYKTILTSVYKGCTTEGTLPGGLNVQRRAKALCTKLTGRDSFKSMNEWQKVVKASSKDFTSITKWVSCFALAVNEQNASMDRIVTSPTNGAAGVIPYVLLYYLFFCEGSKKEDIRRFLFTAGEIGCLFKKGATISAAMGGCQAEIGVSSAMAAAALTEVLRGTPEQCLMAAEIAMEHHLGLTCDPIAGLVQVPCIERNSMGAMKAITAANLALESNPKNAIVNLDSVIKTMWEVSQNMHSKYKETSEGGLAINTSVVLPNC